MRRTLASTPPDDCIHETHTHDDENESLGAALHAQVKQAPWYMGSVVFHIALLIFFLAFAPPERPKPHRNGPRIIYPEFPDDEALLLPDPIELPDDSPPLDDPMSNPSATGNISINTPDITTPMDAIETDDFEDDQEDPTGLDEQMADIEDDISSTMRISLPDPGKPRTNSPFTSRSRKNKNRLIRTNGADPITLKRVGHALAWLATHQEPDGSWDPRKYDGGSWKVGLTALATLAFLGDGNSTRGGQYAPNVKRAVAWLTKQQKPNGCIGTHRYEAGIVLMALSEAAAMSGDRRIKTTAQKLGAYCAKTQSALGGWDYSPSPNSADSSVTGWYVMGLKSAAIAKLSLPQEIYDKSRQLFTYGTADNGTCFYKQQGNSPRALKPGGNTTLGAVSLTCLQFLGADKNDPKVVACAERSLKMLPDPKNLTQANYYRLYYQALGLIQMGARSHYWKTFNPPMKKKLIALQVMDGDYTEDKGSWPPLIDHHGKQWSRIGTTAVACLTMEVYYRYDEIHRTHR